MSKDINVSEHILAKNGGYRVYKPLNHLRNTQSFGNWGIFSHVMCFDQSHMSDKI